MNKKEKVYLWYIIKKLELKDKVKEGLSNRVAKNFSIEKEDFNDILSYLDYKNAEKSYRELVNEGLSIVDNIKDYYDLREEIKEFLLKKRDYLDKKVSSVKIKFFSSGIYHKYFLSINEEDSEEEIVNKIKRMLKEELVVNGEDSVVSILYRWLYPFVSNEVLKELNIGKYGYVLKAKGGYRYLSINELILLVQKLSNDLDFSSKFREFCKKYLNILKEKSEITVSLV